MTLSLPEPERQGLPIAIDPTGGRLVAWAEGLAAAHRIGSALCQTAFVPTHFRGKPDDTAAAILYGDEIGFSPTQAVQNIHVISGKPGMYARAMVALVQSKGHEVWTETATPAKVTVCGRRRGSPHTERSEWTIDKARKAGYTSNKKYETAPEDMLYARAASTVCRRIAADALAGVAYSLEELELEEPQQTRAVTRARTGPVKVQRVSAPEPAEPALDDPAPAADESPAEVVEGEPPADEPDDGQPSDLTARTRGRLFALLTERGIDDADEQRAGFSNILDRPIASRGELTEADANAIIAHLTKGTPS